MPKTTQTTGALSRISLPSKEFLCLDLPLYSEVDLDDSMRDGLIEFIRDKFKLECFCVECGQKSIFHNKETELTVVPHHVLYDRTIFHRFWCARNDSHIIEIWLKVVGKKLVKTGQYPSYATIATGDIDKYRKLLDKDSREFSKAIGLSAHGVGIGSFVYLRRIIEHLVEEVHLSMIQTDGWDEPQYARSRFNEKIQILSERLPEFLSDNPVLYGILSKGIHELEEQECLEAFPVMRIAIELILDEKLVAKEKAEKIKSAKERLAELKKKHVP